MKSLKMSTLRNAATLVLVVSLGTLVLSIFGLSGIEEGRMQLWWVFVTIAALILLSTAIWLFRIHGAINREWTEEIPQEKQPEISSAPPPPPTEPKQEQGKEALLLLSLFQEKGRLVDFLMEDVTSYGDPQVAAAARVVHQGCREVVQDVFNPQPLAPSGENASMTLEPGYDAAAYKIVGNPSGDAPYQGKIAHKGWKAQQVKLPVKHENEKDGEENQNIIVPAEIQF